MAIAPTIREQLDELLTDYTGGEGVRENGVGGFLSKQTLAGYPVGAATGVGSITVPISVERIQTSFYSPANIRAGGAVYVRSSAAPTYPSWYRLSDNSVPGWLQSAGGQWWRMAEEFVTPEMFGAIGDGNVANMAADTRACQGAINYSSLYRVSVHSGQATYMIDGHKGDRLTWTNGGEWAHGGLVWRDGASWFGAGPGKTIFRNGAAYWRSVIRFREGGIDLRGATIDGNIDNYVRANKGSLSPTSGSIAGGGLMAEGGSTTGLDISLLNLEIVNTGGYGLGLQNIYVRRAAIKRIAFANIGDDCLDIKWFTSPDYYKHLNISDIYVADGCGHDVETDKPVCIDIGGRVNITGVYIASMNRTKWTGGIRLRGKVSSQDRWNAEGSNLSNFIVISEKTAGTGNLEGEAPLGLIINSEDVNISNGSLINCLYGVYATGAGNSAPRRFNLSNIRSIGCTGADDCGKGFYFESGCTDFNAVNLIADGNDTGLDHEGKGNFANVQLTNNKVGLVATDTVLASSSITGLAFDGNDIDRSGGGAPMAASAFFKQGFAVVGPRALYHDSISTADDSSWTGENLWVGGRRFWTSDASGTGPGLKARDGLRATGGTGSSFEYLFEIAGITYLRFGAGYFNTTGDMTVSGKVQPATDNAHALGGISNRWTGVYTARVYYSATVFDAVGTGSPEGGLTAGIGSTYRRINGGAATTFYVKESGTGNTGWVAK